MGGDWKHFGTVTGWYRYDITASNTLYIDYRESENGRIRKYRCTTPEGLFDIVEKNSYYHCNCNDQTREYRYLGCGYVFNASLPKFSD